MDQCNGGQWCMVTQSAPVWANKYHHMLSLCYHILSYLICTSWNPSNGTAKFYLWCFVCFKKGVKIYFSFSAKSYRSTSSISLTDWGWGKTATLDEKYISFMRKIVPKYGLLPYHPHTRRYGQTNKKAKHCNLFTARIMCQYSRNHDKTAYIVNLSCGAITNSSIQFFHVVQNCLSCEAKWLHMIFLLHRQCLQRLRHLNEILVTWVTLIGGVVIFAGFKTRSFLSESK